MPNPIGQTAADESGDEGQANYPTLLRNRFRLLVRQVARVVAKGTEVGVGRKDRFAGNLHHIPETALRKVGDIHSETQPFAFSDDCFARFCQPTRCLSNPDAIRQFVAVVPSQRQAADAEAKEEAKELHPSHQR